MEDRNSQLAQRTNAGVAGTESNPTDSVTQQKTRSRFHVVSDTANVLLIRDDYHYSEHEQDCSRTVTNDAEAVVAALASELDGRRLFYVDSDNRMDEILVRVIRPGVVRFAGFRAL